MLIQRINKVYSFRGALWDMAVGEFKSRYAGSRLGIWWAVLTPLLLAASINFVFSFVFKTNEPHYTFFVLAGIIPWLFFANTLQETAHSFVVHAPLLTQSQLPKEIVLFSCLLANLLIFLIGFIFLLPLFVIINAKVFLSLCLLPLAILLQAFFILGLGFFFSVANLFVRDLSHFLSAVFMVWFWVTPVFYSLEMLEFPFRWVCLLNPMAYYVIFYQSVLFRARAPEPFVLAVAFALSIAVFLAGYLFYLRNESALLKRL